MNSIALSMHSNQSTRGLPETRSFWLVHSALVTDTKPRHAVLWHESAEAIDIEVSEPPSDTDVVVVGGGYCGLRAATTLARDGRSVVVVDDADDLGWGASTRNGGMVIPELKSGPQTLARRFGELGARLHAEVDEAFDHVEALIRDEDIDCDYHRSGQLYLAHDRSRVEGLEALAAEHRAIGHGAAVVAGADLSAEIGSTRFPAGLILERTGGVHPAKLHTGLVRIARAAGASLHPRTRAESLERHPGGFTVATQRGAIRTEHVLLATNAYADGLEPRLARRVLPMGSFIIATEPLGDELANAVLPTRRMCFDTKNLLWYWRLDAENRMVFGGRRRLGPVELDDAAAFLRRSMVEVHPQLADVRVEQVWGGSVALTLDRLPHAGVIDGVHYATGCNGSGVALNTWLGHRMAQAIDGEPLPACAELAHRPIPLHRFRRAWLPLVSAFYRLADRRG